MLRAVRFDDNDDDAPADGTDSIAAEAAVAAPRREASATRDDARDHVAVPHIDAVAVRHSLAWVSPEAFLQHAAHVSDVVARLEARLVVAERELVASKAREVVLRADMERSQEEKLATFESQTVRPFMARVRAELDALNSKVDALAFRLDAQLGDLTARHAETRKTATTLTARASSLEGRADAAAAQGADLVEKSAFLYDALEKVGTRLQAEAAAAEKGFADAGRAVAALQDLGQREAVKVLGMEARLASMDTAHAEHRRAAEELREARRVAEEAAATRELKTSMDIAAVEKTVVGRVEHLEAKKHAREALDMEAIANLEADVFKLLRAAADHHRHDAYDDPVAVHGRALDVLSRKVTSHAFLLTNLLGRAPPTGPVPTSSPPPRGGRSPPRAASSDGAGSAAGLAAGSAAGSAAGGDYEDDFEEEAPSVRRPDFSHRLQSDMTSDMTSHLARAVRRFRPGSPSKASARVAPGKSPRSHNSHASPKRGGSPFQDRSWRG